MSDQIHIEGKTKTPISAIRVRRAVDFHADPVPPPSIKCSMLTFLEQAPDGWWEIKEVRFEPISDSAASLPPR